MLYLAHYKIWENRYLRKLYGKYIKEYNNNWNFLTNGIQETSCYAITYNTALKLKDNLFPIRAAADGYITQCINYLNLFKNIYLLKGDLVINASSLIFNNSSFKSTIDLDSNIENDISGINRYNNKLLNNNIQYSVIHKEHKNLYILDNTNDKLNPVVRLLFRDLSGGFKRLGFNINYNANVYNITNNSIILFDNNVNDNSIQYLSNNITNSLFIGWCCHTSNIKQKFINLNMLFITAHTTKPRVYVKPNSNKKELDFDQYNIVKDKQYVPLFHRVNESPNLIGSYNRNVKYDWCHIGKIYNNNLLPKNKFTNNKVEAETIGKYINSDERRDIYLSSLIHIATQGDQNILDGHVSQRVYEGLAYGCIVLSNSHVALTETNNIVEYVNSIQDVENKIEYYKKNPEKVKEKQKLAYEFIKKYGTNKFSIDKINEKSKQLYNIDFIANKEIHELVSIAISTYEANGKGPTLLEHNIKQILKQTYSNIEIIISDHSSNDEVKKICTKYNNIKYPIKYIHNQTNLGNSSQNTNNAINYCNGEYIKVLFMDDYLYNENAISDIVKQFQSHPNKKWLVHSYIHTKNYKDFYNLHHPKFSHDLIFCNRIGCPSCLTIHKSVKERFDEKLKWFMDSELYNRIKIKYNEPIILHTNANDKAYMVNVHHENQVTNTSIDNKLINDEKIYINNKMKSNEDNYKTLMELADNTRTDKNTIHAFLPLYEKLFKKKKYSATNVLEVGLGQRGACHCGSAKLWSDYFVNADTYAIEIYDKKYLWDGILNNDRIKIFTSTNAYDEKQIKEKLFSKNIKFDILLDDGSHELRHMKLFIQIYSKLLKNDGILLIEDIPKIEWLDILSNEVPENMKKYIKTYDLRKEKNRFDDIVFTIDLS